MSESNHTTVSKPLNIAILTISDSRTEADDKSGHILVKYLTHSGHNLADKQIVTDNIYQIEPLYPSE